MKIIAKTAGDWGLSLDDIIAALKFARDTKSENRDISVIFEDGSVSWTISSISIDENFIRIRGEG